MKSMKRLLGSVMVALVLSLGVLAAGEESAVASVSSCSICDEWFLMGTAHTDGAAQIDYYVDIPTFPIGYHYGGALGGCLQAHTDCPWVMEIFNEERGVVQTYDCSGEIVRQAPVSSVAAAA